MTDRLAQIVATIRRRVSEARAQANLDLLEQRTRAHTPRGFRSAIEEQARKGVAVIAELKKASPSKGLIRPEFDVRVLATEMADAGAAALSVLTEPHSFEGSLENLSLASACSPLPCLRKDFIIDEFQLLEARAHHADAVLLIVAALSSTELRNLVRRSRELELDVLCEVHDEDELTRALDADCNLIGVNSRNLRTFEVDLNTAARLGELIPKDVFGVAESGIHSGQDISRLRAEGYQAFLVGESLMKAERPGQALRTLLAEARTTVSSF
ncbi:MAG TPA: indole-3-glycerol phosphate synthase TrpC [Terriglobales bacterium]|nr:indole-3-glycerol phosphate synthase TrpC [Terriglobales bacterium]